VCVEAAWIACVSISLLAPVSPSSRTGEFTAAALRASASEAFAARSSSCSATYFENSGASGCRRSNSAKPIASMQHAVLHWGP